MAVVWRAGDIARLYRVDESTVHRWERTGRLRSARRDPGGTKYWLQDEVLKDVTEAAPPSSSRTLPTESVAELVAATRRRRRRAG